MLDDFDISMIDMTQRVPENSVVMINAGGLVFLSVCLVLLFIMFIRYKSKIIPVLAGIAGYIIFIFMGSNLLLGAMPAFASTTNKVSGVQITVTALILTMFYTFARICIVNILKGHYEGPGDTMIAGLGLGIGDGIVYAVSSIMTMGVLAAAINSSGMEDLLLNNGLSADEAVNFYQTSVVPLLNVPSVVWLLMGIGMSMDTVANIAFMMLVNGASNGKLSKSWYGIAAAMNFVMLLPFTTNAMNYTSVVEAGIQFVIKAVIFAVIIYIVYQADKRYLGSTIHADLRGYTYEKMPKFGNLRNK